MIRQFFELQFLLQFLHQARLLLFGIEFFGLLQAIELILLAVHLAQLQQMLLVAALRHEELRIVQRPLHLERHNNLLRLALESLPDLWNRSKQQLLVGFIELALVFERETLVYGAILNVNIVDERRAVSLVVHNGEHINVGDGMAHNLTFSAETLYKQVLLLQFFRLFKLQFGGFLLHLLENML